MSWSYGAVHEKGLILKENDLKELLKLSNKFKKNNDLTDKDIEEIYGGDLQDYAYGLNVYNCYVTICDIYRLVGFNENGEGQYDNIDVVEDENIYVMWLKKDNLLNSYSGLEEIIKEIEDNIVEQLEVDIQLVYEKLGKDFITNRVGLATGFFSDR